MRKTLLLLLLLFSISFPLNVTANTQPGEIIFLIDGNHYERVNLTLFILRDGVQVNDVEKSDVLLPQLYAVQHNGTGSYELRAADSKGESASALVNFTIASPAPSTAAEQQKEDEQGTLYAIIAALIGIAVLGLILLRFLKSNSDNK
ncbi:MAG: hypothetical protein PHS02_02015 [Candidatus ainarchaeum sp.]|nr:hypothetical protein [Candidatus ainarchaeum sp.]